MVRDDDTAVRIPLLFYRSPSGNEPVRDWLKGLERDDRLALGMDLLRVQYRWPVGMPLCRPMGGGLWEIRASLPWVHQEDPEDAGRGSENRAQAHEGG